MRLRKARQAGRRPHTTVAGRDSHPLRSGTFHGALDHCPKRFAVPDGWRPTSARERSLGDEKAEPERPDGAGRAPEREPARPAPEVGEAPQAEQVSAMRVPLAPAPELEPPRRRRRHRHLPRRRRPSGCLARRPPRARPGRMPGRATPGPRQSRPRRSGTASSWFPQDLPDRVVRHRSAVGADAHTTAEGTGRGRQRPRSPAPGCRADRPARQRVGRAHRLRPRGTDVTSSSLPAGARNRASPRYGWICRSSRRSAHTSFGRCGRRTHRQRQARHGRRATVRSVTTEPPRDHGRSA